MLQSLWQIKNENPNLELSAPNRQRQELEKASGCTALDKAQPGTHWHPNLGWQDTQSCREVLWQQAHLVSAGVIPLHPLACDTHSAQKENARLKFGKKHN